MAAQVDELDREGIGGVSGSAPTPLPPLSSTRLDVSLGLKTRTSSAPPSARRSELTSAPFTLSSEASSGKLPPPRLATIGSSEKASSARAYGSRL